MVQLIGSHGAWKEQPSIREWAPVDSKGGPGEAFNNRRVIEISRVFGMGHVAQNNQGSYVG
jgi:hypothetical protein